MQLALIDILLIEFLQQLLQSGSALSFGAARADMARSVLDDLGEEVTGRVARGRALGGSGQFAQADRLLACLISVRLRACA